MNCILIEIVNFWNIEFAFIPLEFFLADESSLKNTNQHYQESSFKLCGIVYLKSNALF